MPGIPAECTPSGYQELNEASRYWSYDDGNVHCDADNITDNRWYRFTGEAGTMMAAYCIPQSTCNTHMTGWIDGGDHPSTAYETVTRTVCMHWSSSCCYTSYSVEIRNCSGFYVYKLQKPSGCSERYCGVQGEIVSCVDFLWNYAALLIFLSYFFFYYCYFHFYSLICQTSQDRIRLQ